MRVWSWCHLRAWSRRNFLLMSFWYFVLIFSAFLYYTYATWRPDHLYSSLFDKPAAEGAPSAGAAVLMTSRDMLLWQSAELKRILHENPSLDGRYSAVPAAGDARDGGRRFPGAPPVAADPRRVGSAPRKAGRSGNPGVRHDADDADGGAAAANEGELEEEVEVDEEGRLLSPITDTMELTTTANLENLTPPLPPVVDGYEQVDSGENLRLHCGRCAVVSSSGHLINKSKGGQIDSAECVLRMNSAPTAGYERDVGTRTSVRVIGHVNLLVLNSSLTAQREIFRNRSSRAEKIVVPWLHPVTGKRQTDKYHQMASNFSRAYPDVEFYFLTPEKSKLAEEIFKLETGLTTKEANTWLTTGWMALLFAIDVCDEIDIYGLVDESYCREHPNDSTPYHYYEPRGIIECKYYQRSEERLTGGHLFITEKAVFARWANRFNFSFHNPSWDIPALTANVSLALETPFLKKFYEAKRNNLTVSSPRKVVRRVVRRIVVRRKVPVAKKTTS